jgi:UDP-N-acetylglucosamine 4,6-dehydratase
MKSILITGGTGSFGQAFVRHLLETEEYERICVYSRGEHTQAAMVQRLASRGNVATSRLRFFIGDVRDRWRLTRACDGVDVFVHAAALKRIEVGFYNPVEMVKTNIGGAVNVVEASRDAGVAKVVFLSSDKAYQPVSPYGQSKALAERIFLAANAGTGPAYAVTRYGNVWNSAGSVYPTWMAILASGSKCVPVTDPDCTRFFMYLREAVALVSSTIRDMRGGETNIPTLPAYRLGDLASAMSARVMVTGLPEWEKRHESMGFTNTSDKARRLSVNDLKGIISETQSV